MNNEKMIIEVVSDDVANITFTYNGMRQVKSVPMSSVVEALSRKSNRSDTGILSPGLVNKYTSGQHTAYHIFCPARDMMVKHLMFKTPENYVRIRMPATLMSFYVDGDRNHMYSSCLMTLETEDFNPNAHLYYWCGNNYTKNYGICWGSNERIAIGLLKRDDFDSVCHQLPHVFFNSTFNNHLGASYHLKDDLADDAVKYVRDAYEHEYASAFNLYAYVAANNLTYDFSLMLDNPSRHEGTVRSFIESFNLKIGNN